ncbi:MAG: oligosaccharide flippase family protein, partial [Bacteroidota bacterium]
MSVKVLSYLWNTAEKFANQSIRFAIGIILARILSPRDYGLLGLLIVFTAIAQIFVDSGFSKALIQRNDKNPNDVNTTFTFNLLISVVLYILLFFAAPLIANFYEEEILVDLLRVLAFTLILNALFTIQNTVLSIDLDFKRIAFIKFAGIALSGIIAMVLALKGFGVWALVIQHLSKSLITLVFYWATKVWKPVLMINKESLKRLFGFGINITLSSLLNS